MVAAKINESLLAREVDITSVTPHPENYNKHDIGKIRESLSTNGQYRSIVVDAGTRYILAGNGTYAAARGLSWESIAAEFVTVTPEQARRILLVDNFAATDDYDTEAVLKILDELGGELGGTGIDAGSYEKMLADLNGGNADEEGEKHLDEAYGFSVIVEADDEQMQARLLEEFEAQGLVCRAFTM